DTHLLDLEDFKYGGSNITAVRLLDNTKPAVAHIMRELEAGTARYNNREQDYKLRMGPSCDDQTFIPFSPPPSQTETALMYDAVHLFVLAIQALDNSTDVQVSPLVCEGEEAWLHGNSLINYMKLVRDTGVWSWCVILVCGTGAGYWCVELVNMTGLTGHIEFDSLGFRTNFDLDIVELDLQGFVPAGSWNLLQGANYTRTFQEVHDQAIRGLKNKTLIVSFAFTDPYIMRKKSAHRLTGNDRFEGFCVSLLDEISALLGFNYTLVPIKGNVYGTKDSVTGEWNGMIRELLTQRADMAITDLTINYEREQAVDFTMPFMNLGISIIYKKPQKMAPSLFSFLSPLSVEVWMYMITAYVGVSMILYILARCVLPLTGVFYHSQVYSTTHRFTPYEWQNPHPCDPEPESLENQFTMLNCMWFAIGSLMQQGCDFLPQAVSTRMVAGMWWFFTLIMISSYTANLAAFLTVERMESPIESAEDLSKQTKIKYGAYKSGSTAAFFRDSTLPTYQRMWQYMNSTPDVFVNSNAEGFQRVQSEDELYAFLSESTSIEYVTERFCDLVQIGGLLDSKSYGIALPPGQEGLETVGIGDLRGLRGLGT
ncbi:Ionotropic glutamate receptor L-glutamate and glycine-binding domain, partial [Trinorchestia longiramus]